MGFYNELALLLTRYAERGIKKFQLCDTANAGCNEV